MNWRQGGKGEADLSGRGAEGSRIPCHSACEWPVFLTEHCRAAVGILRAKGDGKCGWPFPNWAEMRAPSTILRVPLQAMLAYIRRHGLMRPGDRVGVAVSGGADSVALLRLLLEARAELGVVLSVVHFNHKIRGAEADADEQFVRELAGQHGLEFH